MASPMQWTWTWANSRRWSGTEAWCAAVHATAKSQAWLGDWTTFSSIWWWFAHSSEFSLNRVLIEIVIFIYYPKFFVLHILKLSLHIQQFPSTEKQNVKCSEMWVVISIRRLKKCMSWEISHLQCKSQGCCIWKATLCNFRKRRKIM